ncbi:hypothetical protein EJ110_NYTH33208 [Nymphaea thermarum]|nr:hypothetical protein EJ110_NYTH33208 [Nymphaea thermarum]
MSYELPLLLRLLPHVARMIALTALKTIPFAMLLRAFVKRARAVHLVSKGTEQDNSDGAKFEKTLKKFIDFD